MGITRIAAVMAAVLAAGTLWADEAVKPAEAPAQANKTEAVKPAAEAPAAVKTQAEAPAKQEAAQQENCCCCEDAGPSWCKRACYALMMYIPNRIVDFADIVSVDLGLGLRGGANVYLTRALVTGAQIGYSSDMMWDYDRQAGFAIDDGWDAHFLFTGAEDTERMVTAGPVRKYWQVAKGFSVPSEHIYTTKARDYWSIGLEGSALLHAKVLVHPVSIVDFVTGLFFIDLEDDDYTLNPVQ